MKEILVLSPKERYEGALAAGQFITPALADEGFIHGTSRETILYVANKHYISFDEVLILVIDEEKVGPEVKWEGKADRPLFPHIYGPLNLNAIVQVLPYRNGADGQYHLPEGW